MLSRPDHASARASACFKTIAVISSWPSGGYLYLRRIEDDGFDFYKHVAPGSIGVSISLEAAIWGSPRDFPDWKTMAFICSEMEEEKAGGVEGKFCDEKCSQVFPGEPRTAGALTSAAGDGSFPLMDTMKILLGATIALLLGALAVSWQNMKHGVDNASADEVQRLRKQIAELRQEQDHLNLQKKLQQIQATAPPVVSSSSVELEVLKQQVAAQQAAMNVLEEQRKNERDKDLDRDEEGLIAQAGLENKDTELKRARMISNALLVARVREYVKDSQFITFEILIPEANIQPGTVLGVRRKTGILGTFKVSGVEAEGGVANPLPGFGEFEPKPGDELIIPPY